MMFSMCFTNLVQLIANSNSAKLKLLSSLYDIQSTEIHQWYRRQDRWRQWLGKQGDLNFNKLARLTWPGYSNAPSETVSSEPIGDRDWRNILRQSMLKATAGTHVIFVTIEDSALRTWSFIRRLFMMDGSTVVQFVRRDSTRRAVSSLIIEEITTKTQFLSCTIFDNFIRLSDVVF